MLSKKQKDKLFYLSIASSVWVLVVTFAVNPLVKGKWWNAGASPLNLTHNQKGWFGGICNFGLLTNLLLAALLLGQAFIFKFAKKDKTLKTIGLISFLILAIYFMGHFYLNSSFNYILRKYECKGTVKQVEACDKYVRNLIQGLNNCETQKHQFELQTLRPDEEDIGASQLPEPGPLQTKNTGFAFGLWDYMLPMYIMQLVVLYTLYSDKSNSNIDKPHS